MPIQCAAKAKDDPFEAFNAVQAMGAVREPRQLMDLALIRGCVDSSS